MRPSSSSGDASPSYPRHVAVIGAAGGLGQGILRVCREERVRFTAIVRSRPERVANVPTGSRVLVVEDSPTWTRSRKPFKAWMRC